MASKFSRERLSVDLPTRFMRMLDEMCGEYTRTTIIMQAIEEKYLLIQARKPPKPVAVRDRGYVPHDLVTRTITDDEATFFEEYGRMPEPGEIANPPATRAWGKPKS